MKVMLNPDVIARLAVGLLVIVAVVVAESTAEAIAVLFMLIVAAVAIHLTRH